jgi:hypothetical protein
MTEKRLKNNSCVCMFKIEFKIKLIFLDIKLWSELRRKIAPLPLFPNISGHLSQKINGISDLSVLEYWQKLEGMHFWASILTKS